MNAVDIERPGPQASKPYRPSPPPTDPRIECKHHVAFVDCRICNPRDRATSQNTGAGLAQPRPITHVHSSYGVRRCPVCTAVLDGGPVQFRCEPCRRTVYAADLPHETTRPLVPSGSAA